jgi:acetolactate synthase-1/3 small subunit
MKYTLACLVYNKPGVLAKIAKTFAAEGINIHSIAAGEIEQQDKTRMTMVVDSDEHTIKRAEMQLLGIEEVIKLEDLKEGELIAMELLLIKIRIQTEKIPQILQIAELFNAQVIGVSETAMVLALNSEDKRVNGLIKMLLPYGIIEMSRSGKIAVTAP